MLEKLSLPPPSAQDYVIPEPPVPRPFRFHVTGMLSAVEACPTGSQVTLHDEAYVASLAGNMAVVPRPPVSLCVPFPPAALC